VTGDRRILYAAAFLRAVSTSLTGVLMGVYLARLAITGAALGGIISAGLAGSAAAAVVATLFADRWGRRHFLLAVTALSVLGAAAFALTDSAWGLGAAAFVGMLNGMGRDRGAALILEQAVLPSTTIAAERTRVIAWYNMLQDCGHAVGALCAGLPALLATTTPLRGTDTHRAAFFLCAGLGICVFLLYTRLGPNVEAEHRGRPAPLTARSRHLLIRISALFAVDSLAGGFLTTALLSYFFFARFGASEVTIGSLFFGARILNAGSHLAAAWLARRIGLVNTMVFTHIPSSLLLVTVAFAPSFTVAAVLFLLREGLVEMDVPTRQSYVLAVVEPNERTVASGVTNLVRVAAWAVAPPFASLLMHGNSMGIPLAIGAAMKISYDLLLLRAFRGIRPPEEQTGA